MVDPLRGHRDRRERHPRVGERAHRRRVRHVVPDEEAVPAALLGARRQLAHDARLRQLLEGSHEDAVPSVQLAALDHWVRGRSRRSPSSTTSTSSS